MDLVIYNRKHTDIGPLKQSIYIRAAMLYVTEVSVCSFISATLSTWHWRNTWSEKETCTMFDSLFIQQHPNSDGAAFYKHLKEVRGTKNKNKQQLIHHHKVEESMKQLKQDVFKWFTGIIGMYQLDPILEYCAESDKAFKEAKNKDDIELGAIKLMSNSLYMEESEGEDHIIKDIVSSLLEEEQCFILEEEIERVVPFAELESNEKTTTEPIFFSAYLFELPNLNDLTLNQLKNIREELKPVVNPFQEGFKEFKKELSAIPFGQAKTRIKSLFDLHISPHLLAIQQKSDEHIYIQQQKNRYGDGSFIKVMLGISSLEEQIHLLEKEGTLLPFVENAILEKLEKNINIKNCFPFIYHKLSPLPDIPELALMNNKSV
ncbi:MAG: hypothetical protein ACYDCN_16590 [Bacteroidia bacterium]